MRTTYQSLISLAAVAAMSLLTLTAAALPVERYAENSRLSEGKWVRVSVSQTGIHELTQEFIQSQGFSRIENIRVYGYGGRVLSETLTDSIPDDLPEVPVVREAGRLLFYAHGPVSWLKCDSLEFKQRLHPYSTLGYYFITERTDSVEAAPRRSERTPQGEPVTTFVERLYHEQELVNPVESGRNFLGEDFMTKPSQSYHFDLPGHVAGTPVSVLAQVGVKLALGECQFVFTANGKQLPSDPCETISPPRNLLYYEPFLKTYTARAADGNIRNMWAYGTTKRFDLDGESLDLGVNLRNSGTLTYAHLDYITVNYNRRLAIAGNELCFATDSLASADACYVLAGATEGTRVWDVTVPYEPVEMLTELADGGLRFSPIEAGYREYVAFTGQGNYPSPVFANRQGNQNLHAEPVPDMIIITNYELLAQAQRLAAFHEQHDGMRVLVAHEQQVFNEFSSGTPDAMAHRMLCKMMWDRSSDTAAHHLQHLLLMGDGSYDNRHLLASTTGQNRAMVLTWQTLNSFHDIQSYCTEDPFAILDDGSGWPFYAQRLNIGVGRLPVGTVTEAREVVDKIIAYASEPDYGFWKNQSLNVADDFDYGRHMSQAEDAIQTARQHGGEDLIYNHIFIDAFPVTTVGGTRSYPEAKALMMSRLREGVLWWNYTGHASATTWGAEGMLRRTDITDNLYYDHLPVLYAATCNFSRFDGTTECGTKSMVLNPRGGAIATISPTRTVLLAPNGALNSTFASIAFERDADGRGRRLGDIYRMAKTAAVESGTETTPENKAAYVLLGDPALRIALPSCKAVIETINGEPADPNNLPVFQGRQTVTFGGYIADHQGNKLPEFNGTVRSTLFDCEQSITTHGYTIKGENGAEFTYLDRTNRLAMSVDTVSSGKFTIRMTIPSELFATYENYSPSLLNLYAFDASSGLEASGSNSDFYIYGYDIAVAGDSIGPDITYLGLNNAGFTDGDLVNESPIVLATISDASGVNFSTAGIGHNMTLLLDGKTTYSDLSGYYTPQQTSVGTLGTLRFPINDLEPGDHTLRLRVWDVHNNMSERTITFSVATGLKPEVVDVYATSNPAYTSTTFYVEHNRPEAVMSVTIEVYDLLGRPVWSTTQSGRSNQFMTFPVTWDLTRSGGGRVPRGIYVYRATITADGEHEASKAKKLAVGGE